MRSVTAAMMMVSALFIPMSGTGADEARVAQAPPGPSEKSSSTEKLPGKSVTGALTVRGTIDAMDKDKGILTLKGPGGRTLTLEVRDKAKLDAVNVGDPVVATYVEAVAFQVVKAGTAVPGVTTQETRVSSKPGETPGGAIGRQITVTATIVEVDRKAQTVTINGPRGNTETIKAKNPKNLEAIKAGDLVDITYAQALAISLDKPAR
jgi:hypothetical protein